MHRTTRNDAQKAKLLSPNFTAFTLDTILQRLEDPSLEPGFVDPRNCLVLWARPPTPVKHLIAEVQGRLLGAAPSTLLSSKANRAKRFQTETDACRAVADAEPESPHDGAGDHALEDGAGDAAAQRAAHRQLHRRAPNETNQAGLGIR